MKLVVYWVGRPRWGGEATREWQGIPNHIRYDSGEAGDSTYWQAFMIQPSSITPQDENVLESGYCVSGQTREVADVYLWWPGPRLASWPGLSVARTPN